MCVFFSEPKMKQRTSNAAIQQRILSEGCSDLVSSKDETNSCHIRTLNFNLIILSLSL